MAHNLNELNGVTSFFSVKEKPWHNLGKLLDKCPTSEEAIKLANLNFEVDLSHTFVGVSEADLTNNTFASAEFAIREGVATSNTKPKYFEARKIPGTYATFRTDTKDVLGTVGARYQIIQNIEAFDFFDQIVGKGEAIYETAGCLGKGETIFITAKLPDYIEVRKGHDCIEKYLLFTMSHDGSSSITVMFTPVRVVCNNTLTAALQGGSTNKVVIRHTKSAREKLDNAANIMGISNKLTKELGEIFNQMSLKEVKEEELISFVEKLVLPSSVFQIEDKIQRNELISTRSKNTISSMVEYALTGPGQMEEACAGTVYGLYNAITGYFQNAKEYKTNEHKFNALYGNTTDTKVIQRAYYEALSLIKQ